MRPITPIGAIERTNMLSATDLWSDLWEAASPAERYCLVRIAGRAFGLDAVFANITAEALLTVERAHVVAVAIPAETVEAVEAAAAEVAEAVETLLAPYPTAGYAGGAW